MTNRRGIPLAPLAVGTPSRLSATAMTFNDLPVRTHLRSVIGQLREERRLNGTIAVGASGACSRLCMRRGTRMGLLALARTAGSEDALEGEIFIAAEIGNP